MQAFLKKKMKSSYISVYSLSILSRYTTNQKATLKYFHFFTDTQSFSKKFWWKNFHADPVLKILRKGVMYVLCREFIQEVFDV